MYRSKLTGREFESKLGAVAYDYLEDMKHAWKKGDYVAPVLDVMFFPLMLPVHYVMHDRYQDEYKEGGKGRSSE